MLARTIYRPRLIFTLFGVVASLGAPLGWRLLTLIFSIPQSSPYVYAYMSLATTIVFAMMGIILGSLYERIKSAAERDDLTGLFNQSAFIRTASVLQQLAIRHAESISILMMDIDRFKEVNDKHNHLVGSHVLKQIARIIDRGVRRSDLTARFGGDEYIFCLPRTDLPGAQLIAERLRREIEAEAFIYGDHKVRVTVSIGIAACNKPKPDLALSKLIEKADEALYAAKNQGRNRVLGIQLDI